jgi:hypothetical protein
VVLDGARKSRTDGGTLTHWCFQTPTMKTTSDSHGLSLDTYAAALVGAGLLLLHIRKFHGLASFSGTGAKGGAGVWESCWKRSRRVRDEHDASAPFPHPKPHHKPQFTKPCTDDDDNNHDISTTTTRTAAPASGRAQKSAAAAATPIIIPRNSRRQDGLFYRCCLLVHVHQLRLCDCGRRERGLRACEPSLGQSTSQSPIVGGGWRRSLHPLHPRAGGVLVEVRLCLCVCASDHEGKRQKRDWRFMNLLSFPSLASCPSSPPSLLHAASPTPKSTGASKQSPSQACTAVPWPTPEARSWVAAPQSMA